MRREAGTPVDALAAALRRAGRMAQAGPRYRRSVEPCGRWWVWQIVDETPSPHVVAASGRAWTKRRAWVRLERAYRRVLAEVA
jgi:hypothetical protein